ncbi:putative Ras GTPase activator [Trypoxylus dichotomus]
MVETCLPVDDLESESGELRHFTSMLSVSSTMNLSSSLSSLACSPTEKEACRDMEPGCSSSLEKRKFPKKRNTYITGKW